MSARRRKEADTEVDTVAEVDRLEGFPHPRETLVLHGHEPQEALLAEGFIAGHLHHAFLIAGPRGIGKATLAYRMARFVLAEPGERSAGGSGGGLAVDPDGRTTRQVRAMSHPGLMILRRAYDPQKKRTPSQIGVDEVRRLRGFMTQTAAAGCWRVVVVDAAEEMTVSAANALLKTLEEPPARSLFLIVTSAPGKLLATIHSRCRTLRLQPLAPEPLHQAVAAAVSSARAAGAAGGAIDVPDGAALQEIAELANGAPRRVLQLVAVDGMALYREISGLLEGLPRLDRSGLARLSERLAGSQNEASYNMALDLLAGAVAVAVRGAAAGTSAGDNRLALALSRHLGSPQKVAQWASLWETLQRERAEVDLLNLDRRSFILEAFLRIEAATRG
ncbi:MAG: DNA polymerase III subunit delta' [Rhizobiales bacterium]|nr:DNA polymerase III subunit delta' [Hyphomicrobiales bacterium]